MNKKLIVGTIIAIIIVVVALIYYGDSYSTKSDVITIGALYPLTGGLASYGDQARRMAQIAVDEINKNGGIDGKRLEIDYQDHQCNPKIATSILKQLSAVKHINVYTSATCTGTVLSIAPILEETNSLLLGTVISGDKITGVSPNVFRNWTSDKKASKLFAEEIQNRGYKKIAVIYEETAYAKGLKIGLEEFLKDSDIQIISESFMTGATDVRTQLTKIKSENPELLFISAQVVPSGEVVLRQMEELNFKPTIFINDNILKAKDLVLRYKDLLEGALGGDYILTKGVGLEDALASYKDRYGEECPQTNVCASVYDSVNLLAEAIGEKGQDTKKIRKYLSTVNYEGVTGTISFDSNNDRTDANYSLFIIKNGEAELYK